MEAQGAKDNQNKSVATVSLKWREALTKALWLHWEVWADLTTWLGQKQELWVGENKYLNIELIESVDCSFFNDFIWWFVTCYLGQFQVQVQG